MPEQGAADLLDAAQVGKRVHREGLVHEDLVHEDIELAFDGPPCRALLAANYSLGVGI